MMWDEEAARRARELQRARDLQRQRDSAFASQSEKTGGGGCPALIGLVALVAVAIKGACESRGRRRR